MLKRAIMSLLVPASIGVAFLFVSLSHGATRGMISGTVKGPDGEPFMGAFIRAQNRKTKVTVIVLSDRQGKYRIQNLTAGEYDVWAATVGYKNKSRSVSLITSQPVRLDLGLQSDVVRWSDLTNHQGKVLLPDGPGKTVLFTKCMACHGLQTQIAALRLNEKDWRDSIEAMRDPKRVANGKFTDEEAAALVPYLTKVFGVDSKVPSPAEMPRYQETVHREFSNEAMKLTYVEYDVPGPHPNSYEATPNPNKKGNVWFVESWSGDGVAELNPETGEIRDYKVPPPHRTILEAHSVVEAPDGVVWFAEQAQCQLNKFDPRTKKFSAYRPPSCVENLGAEKIPGPYEVRVDRLGNVWANAATLWRFDPRTEKFTEFPEGGSAYGIELDQRDNLWFAQEWAGKIGKVDIKTLMLKRWTPPATIKLALVNKNQPNEIGQNQVHPKSAGPRHIASDSQGMIWFDEWFAGQLGRFDPDTETFKEFPLPGSDSTPYGIGVDRNDFVWYSSFDNDTLGRLDPTTGTVVEYPLPSSGDEIRQILRDSDGRMWFATSFNGKVGYFVPPEVPKAK
jgi:virginiamycin B lyase